MLARDTQVSVQSSSGEQFLAGKNGSKLDRVRAIEPSANRVFSDLPARAYVFPDDPAMGRTFTVAYKPRDADRTRRRYHTIFCVTGCEAFDRSSYRWRSYESE